MATQTTNYGLTKPSYNETADIGVINSNMDIIDAKMKEIDNKAGSGGGGGTSDYLQLSNKPKINGVELVDNTTTEDLGIVVPQYTSELENDSGFITNETDPTVPAWAKEPTKPTYTAEEVGALPSNTPIPDPTSVVVDRFVSVGTHIADISVNGEKTELYAPTGGGGTPVTVDSELSTTSENPVQNKVITQALNGKGTYSKPTGGIPKTDLASEVQTSLGKADTALQEHQDISGKANKADLTALSNSISDAWNASTTYEVGKYCIYNNSLWRCLVQHSGQTPTEGTYWTNVTVANEITSVNNSLTANSKHFYFDYKNGKYGYNTNPNRGADTFFPFSSDLENVTFKTSIDKITDAQIGKKYLIVHSRGVGYIPSVLSGATVLNSKTYQGTGDTAYEGIFIVKATSTTIVMDGGGCPVIYAEI